jgi:hypothetical protein
MHKTWYIIADNQELNFLNRQLLHGRFSTTTFLQLQSRPTNQATSFVAQSVQKKHQAQVEVVV